MVCAETKHEEPLPTLLANKRHWQTDSENLSLQVQKPVRCTSTGMSNITAGFRMLGENETIEDHFSLGTQIYDRSDDGDDKEDKVVNARRKNIEPGCIQDCVVKVRKKRRTKDEECIWRPVMSRLIASKVCAHVLKIQEILEDKDVFYVVMEKCSGGELFSYLENATEVKMFECKRIIREILVGLHDLHSKGLIHGDVKPENIMFSDNTSRNIKLIDFDTCKPWDSKAPKAQRNVSLFGQVAEICWGETQTKAQRFVGTPGYIAPEVLLGQASPQSDLWSVGVIMYILMMGYMPFVQEIKDGWVGSANSIAVYEDVKKERIDWKEGAWIDFPGAADLCRRLLAFDPLDRTKSATDALRHPWFQYPKLK